MRYVLRQKILSWGEDFTIHDESGREVYYVDGKAFSLGHQLSILDFAGREQAYIRQKLLSWGPSYTVERGGEVLAVVRKHLSTLFACKFTVDVPGPDDLEASGGLLDHEYTFERGGRTVARVTKHWVSFSDSYGVEIDDDEDQVLILASAVVIDLACHDSAHGGKH
ncbi:MAG: LURP-one-related family protein [Isosphaeraceae bacterium]